MEKVKLLDEHEYITPRASNAGEFLRLAACYLTNQRTVYHKWITYSVTPSLMWPVLLQKPVIKKPSTTLGELENSGLLCRWAQRS